MRSQHPPLFSAAISLAACALLAGCGLEKSGWRTYEEVTVNSASPATPMGPSAAPRKTSALSWTAPAGWTEEAGSGMRLAAFIVSREGQSGSCTIITLGGTAGGPEANVRRWIGQLKIEEPAPDEFSAFMQRQPSFQSEGGFNVVVADLTELGSQTPETASMLAAIVTVGDSTLFVKLTGPLGLLKAEKESFMALCRSIKESA